MAGAAVFITALFAGILIAIFISKRTTRPLWKIANKLEELARNKGDLTARIHITNKDEIGKLAAAFNRMLENLQKMMLKIKETTDEVSASALGFLKVLKTLRKVQNRSRWQFKTLLPEPVIKGTWRMKAHMR